MRNICKVTFVVVICAVLLGCVSSAFAAGTSTTSDSILMQKTDWSKDIVLDKFDPSQGTLTGIDVWLSTSINTILTVNNTGGSPSTGHANTHFILTLTDSINNPLVVTDFMSPDFTFTALGAGQQLTSGTISKTVNWSDSINDPLAFAMFTGPGTLTLKAFTFTEAGIFYNGGNTASSQVTEASAIGTVTYHFSPVPEPSSFLGLAGMLLPTAFMIKRRRA